MLTDRQILSFGTPTDDRPKKLLINAGSFRGLYETVLRPYRESCRPLAIWLYRPVMLDEVAAPRTNGRTLVGVASRGMLSIVRISESNSLSLPWITFLDALPPEVEVQIPLPVNQTMALIAASQHLPVHWGIDFASLVKEGEKRGSCYRPEDACWGSWLGTFDAIRTKTLGSYVTAVSLLLKALDEVQPETSTCCGEDGLVRLTLDATTGLVVDNEKRGHRHSIPSHSMVNPLGLGRTFDEYRAKELSVAPLKTKAFIIEPGPLRDSLKSMPRPGVVRLVFSEDLLYVTEVPRFSYETESFTDSVSVIHALRPV